MANWSRAEVEAIVTDYLAMLTFDLAGVPYNKAAHERRLTLLLNGRSDQSIEYKHANVSAALLDLGFPYISGYKPRSNYQHLLAEVVADRLSTDQNLLEIAAADADRPIVSPELDDILAVLTEPPHASPTEHKANEPQPTIVRFPTNYIEREARIVLSGSLVKNSS